MNKFICTAVAVILAAGFTVAAHAQTEMHHDMAAGKDRLPEVHAAMEKLQHAKEDLQKAGDEYGGHRAKAIEHVDAALAELHQAEEFAEHAEHHDHDDNHHDQH